MLKHKVYICQICETSPDQISHHKNHLDSQKHKDKREIFRLKLSMMNNDQLQNEYHSTNIDEIINDRETFYYYEKKLNNNVDDNSGNCKMANIITADQGITNREALRDKIHEIHNYLRNNGAGYGMNALKVFNFLYGLKKIEEKNLIDVVKLKRPECEFSYLLEKAKKFEEEEITELILTDISKSVYYSEISSLLYYEIPQNIKSNVCAHLIKEIDNISKIEDTCNVLLSGKVYEYFIGRDETAISELGAYFTDRHIVNYIYSKLDTTINDNGEIESMIDMFGGSGGFTTGYIDYLNKRYPGKINWTSEINKIYHYDINEDVIKSAGLEFFCMTGVLPKIDNLKFKNAFTDEFSNKKFKNVITNPPYGGDKSKQSDAQIKREKVKDYIKNEMVTITDKNKLKKRQEQLKRIEAEEKQEKLNNDKSRVSVSSCSNRIKIFAEEKNLTGNDKESCSLILMMDLLDVNGTAIGVLKEGVFFNKTYKDIRKCLIENFNVKQIISVPQDQFENTSTKTSIVIFENTEEKTTEVIFKELIIERYENDEFAETFNEDIVLIQNKGDIRCVSDKLISSATRSELLENAICSLNGKDYNKKEIICGEGYELIKLGEICKLENGKQLDKKNIVDGEFPVYGGGSSPVGKHNEFNRECCTIIAGTGNYCGFIQFNENKFWASQCFTMKNENRIINKYLFFICKSNEKIFMKEQSGSAQKFIRASQFTEMKIPIPKSSAKIKEWVDKISAPYEEMNSKKAKLKELELFVQNRIKEIGETEDCEKIELGDLCEIRSGKPIKNEERKGTLFPYYAANGISGYVDEYLFDGKYIICAQDGSIGATHLVNCKFYPSNHVWVLQTNAQNQYIDHYYLYSILKNNIDYEKLTSGSVIPKLTREKLSKILITIPRNKDIFLDLDLTFQEINAIQTELKNAEQLYTRYIQELSEDAIPSEKKEKTHGTVTAIDTATATATAVQNEIMNEEPIVAENIAKKKTKLVKKVEEQSVEIIEKKLPLIPVVKKTAIKNDVIPKNVPKKKQEKDDSLPFEKVKKVLRK